MRSARVLVCALLVLLVAQAAPAAAGERADGSTPDATGEVTVAVLIESPGGLRVAKVSARHEEAGVTAQRMETFATVVVAEVDIPVKAFNDPLRPQQWGMDRLKAETGWTHTDASGQVIAIVDTGVDAEHPDLDGVVVAGYDAFTPNTLGRVDPNGHGTHVAGIAGAVVGNSVGVAGFAKAVEIMPIRVLKEDGTGFSSDVAEGILFAVSAGADVVNLSLGSPSQSSLVTAAVSQAIAAGVVVVAAAGNEGDNGNPVMYPAALDDVIGVGATDQQDGHPSFSGNGSWLDLVAPGVQIASTMNGEYMYSTGTSMAAPFVAATAALVRNRYPDLGSAQLAEHLRGTAEDLGETGFDPLFGHGLVDPVTALTTTPAGTVEAPDEPADDPEPTEAVQEQLEPAVTHVGDDSDAVAAAVEISQTVFPRDGRAPVAVLSRDDAFADSLAGAALAGDRGPILYTSGGPDGRLRPEAAAELTRVLQPGATVTVLGGPNAVSEPTVEAVRDLGFTVRRLHGPSRVETALAIALELDPAPSHILLARADQWADAVTGGAYAAAHGVPLLLTQTDALHPAVQAYLAQAQPAQVVLLGGESALAESVATSIDAKVTRAWGATRAGTAVAIAERLWGRTAASAGDVFVVTDGWGSNAWSAALAGAVLSAHEDAPQLIVNGDDVPPETEAYLERLGYHASAPGDAYIVGPVGGDPLTKRLTELLGG